MFMDETFPPPLPRCEPPADDKGKAAPPANPPNVPEPDSAEVLNV